MGGGGGGGWFGGGGGGPGGVAVCADYRCYGGGGGGGGGPSFWGGAASHTLAGGSTGNGQVKITYALGSTSTSLTAVPSDGTNGPVALTALVTTPGFGGTVAFATTEEGAVPGCGAVPTAGSGTAGVLKATCSTTFTTQRQYHVTATYSGDLSARGSTGSAGLDLRAPAGLKIEALRFEGPSGVAGDCYLQLYNPTTAAVSLSGWSLRAAGESLLLPSASVPAHGRYLIGCFQYSQGAVATPDLAPTGLLLPPGLALVGPDASKVDTVGLSSATSGFREGAGLTRPTAPSAQLGFQRRWSAGHLVDTGDNAADFRLLATDADTVSHGAAAVYGSVLPQSSSSPPVRNRAGRPTRFDPALPATQAPNRVRSGDVLTLRRTLTNTTTATVHTMRLRLTGLSTFGTASDGEALLTAVDTLDATVGSRFVRGLTLSGPTGSRGGGVGSVLDVELPPAGLAPGQSVDVALSFRVLRQGTRRSAGTSRPAERQQSVRPGHGVGLVAPGRQVPGWYGGATPQPHLGTGAWTTSAPGWEFSIASRVPHSR